jgi:FKBP-type peptidyl-prolyl cis-trans isomerase 2
MNFDLVPGTMVRHPTQPGWGLGQVQSVDGHRITVNFENAGKHLINGEVISLVTVPESEIDG